MTEVDRFVFKNTERVTGEELSFRVTVVYPNGMKPPVGKCISEINRYAIRTLFRPNTTYFVRFSKFLISFNEYLDIYKLLLFN